MAMAEVKGGYGEDGIYRSLFPPVPIPLQTHHSLPALLFSGPLADPSNSSSPLLVDSTTGFTIHCGDFQRLAKSVASGLSSIVGVSQGDVVLLLLGNTVYFPILFAAILSIGAVATTANPANTAAEIERQLRDSRAGFVVTMPDLVAKIGKNGQGFPTVILDGENAGAKFFQDHPRFVRFESLLAVDESKFPSAVRIRQGDPAALLYSSGTTGPSKGVLLSHGNLIAAVSILASKPNDNDDKVVTFILLPLFHIAGLIYSGCMMIYLAATMVVVRKFDLLHMLQCIQRFKITSLPMVPPIVVALLKHPAVESYDLSSLKRAASGAAPLAKETLEAFLAKFPQIQEFSQAYGMTETTGLGASGEAPFGSAGLLTANHEAKVTNVDTGKPLPPHSRGELWLRGPCIMQSYLNNPAATAATIDPEGWLHTGDIGYFDDDGFLFIVDRLKELIKYKGFQVAPAELEALLLAHPGIADAAVIPYPDDDAGEIPLACVVRGSGEAGKSLSKDEVMDFIARQVASHKRIRAVTFVPSIPKSATGKILRKDLLQVTRSRSKL
ncbi:4-coumarate--CoA ligase-like 7 [Selaginella moellendorffii]|nr:4-coumarate--CoA ligase-like 7 [Selaginella moellendorffii]XP_024521016.1 4-coumarate--CoA ligase-like 7 [Selaginella moellendorffii]|eukprot:XP_002991507.2 4-coumarate--CoA ligase-like 7 [Selaginella moellendorffii]